MKIEIPENANFILSRLNEAGFDAFVVGGCVRDALLGKTPNDWDVTTSALPEDILRVFADVHTEPTGLKHGTVTVIPEHTPFEVTTFRTDGEYLDNRRPESVEFVGDLSLDLKRRDFTINAMAYNGKVGLIDLFGGREDLKRKVIACVGDADTRFNEDALRIMRALRFAASLGFDISEETEKSIRKNRHLLENIARERIFAELTKLLQGENAVEILTSFEEVVRVILPSPCYPSREELEEKFTKSADFIYRLSVFLQLLFVESEAVRTAARSLRASNFQTDSVVKFAEYYGADYPESLEKTRRFLGVCPLETAERIFRARGFSEEYLKEIKEKRLCCHISELEIDGSDLISLGVPPGKKIGKILEKLLDEVISGNVENDKQALMQYVKNLK